MATQTQRIALTATTFGGSWLALGHNGLSTIVAGCLAWGVASYSDQLLDRVVQQFGGNKNDDSPITEEEILEYRKRKSASKDASTELDGMDVVQKYGITEDDIDRFAVDAASNTVFTPSLNKRFTLGQLLASGWLPSTNKIFIARLDNGTDIYMKLDDIVHIALAGSTRQGKTSIIRHLLAQFCYIGCECVLLDPHFTPYDIDIKEDWTPYIKHLKQDPRECSSYDRIASVLRYAATTFLNSRHERRVKSKPLGKHVFIVIDEYPAIIEEKPEVQKYVAKLLREGGKYRIHLIIASQDFQVRTAFPDLGGSVRDNFSTCLYVGGDKTTVRELLETTIEKPVEAQLGKGPIYLRCPVHKVASLAYTPFTENEAVYKLLGDSTYDPDTEELDNLEDSVEGDTTSTTRTTGDDATTTVNLSVKTHIETDDATTTATQLPSDWTLEQAITAKSLYSERVSKDVIWKSLGKKGTASTRRSELDQILQMDIC